MSIVINIRMKDVKHLEPSFRASIYDALYNASLRIKSELGKLMPVASGRLKGSFVAMPTTEGIELRWDAKYAKYVDEGTPAHDIYPKGEALKFMSPTGIAFAKHVAHPGQIGQHFSTSVGEAAKEIIKEELERAMLNIV